MYGYRATSAGGVCGPPSAAGLPIQISVCEGSWIRRTTSNLGWPRPRLRPVLVVVRVVAEGLVLVLAFQVDWLQEPGRSLLPRWLPATAEVPAQMLKMMLHHSLMMLPVAVMVVLLLVAPALGEVLQEVLPRPELRRLDSVQAHLLQHEDQRLVVPALHVDGLRVGVLGAQVEVAPPVHCLGVLFLPIGIRRVRLYVQCGLAVAEVSCCNRGRSTPVQNLPVVRLSTGSLGFVCVHAYTYLLSFCSLDRLLWPCRTVVLQLRFLAHLLVNLLMERCGV